MPAGACASLALVMGRLSALRARTVKAARRRRMMRDARRTVARLSTGPLAPGASRLDRPVYFFGAYELSSFKLGAAYPIAGLRRLGIEAASGHGVPVEALRDSILVFVKREIPETLERLGRNGNRIVVDMRDNFARAHGGLDPDFVARDVADLLIFPNRALRDHFLSIRPTSSRCEVAYGYADLAVRALFERDPPPERRALRGCYFGFPKGLGEEARSLRDDVEVVPLTEHDFDRQLPRLREFDLHVDWRPPGDDRLYKPLTKILIAAECRSNVLVARAPRVLEILPEDYPFLAGDGEARATFERARAAFGTAEWSRALEIMEEVRTRHSFERHLARLVELLASLG